MFFIVYAGFTAAFYLAYSLEVPHTHTHPRHSMAQHGAARNGTDRTDGRTDRRTDGRKVYEYRTMAQTAYSLLRFLLGDFDFYVLYRSNRVLTPILFFSCV